MNENPSILLQYSSVYLNPYRDQINARLALIGHNDRLEESGRKSGSCLNYKYQIPKYDDIADASMFMNRGTGKSNFQHELMTQMLKDAESHYIPPNLIEQLEKKSLKGSQLAQLMTAGVSTTALRIDSDKIQPITVDPFI